LGRYPFLAEAKVYLKDVRHGYADSTYIEMERKLLYIHGVLLLLKSKGLIATTNPRKIGQSEISAFVDWMEAKDGLLPRPLGEGYRKKLLQHLSNFLAYEDNGIIERMVTKKQLKRPKEPIVVRPSFTEDEMTRLITALEESAVAGSLSALGVFGHAVFCGFAGTRPKEIRLANKGDYSSNYWELMIQHPKGEGAWAEPRIVRVCLPGRGFVADFMDVRARELKRRDIHDRKDLPLVPRFAKTGVERWPDNALHNVKCEVEKDLGLRFDFRKLRRSYGQIAFDKGVHMDFVSKVMGHANVATTQRYYVRAKSAQALDEIDRVYAIASVDSIPTNCGKARCPE
jgi:integrase/recombinase XerD